MNYLYSIAIYAFLLLFGFSSLAQKVSSTGNEFSKQRTLPDSPITQIEPQIALSKDIFKNISSQNKTKTQVIQEKINLVNKYLEDSSDKLTDPVLEKERIRQLDQLKTSLLTQMDDNQINSK